MEAKICRGSWCLAFGFDPIPTLEQVVEGAVGLRLRRDRAGGLLRPRDGREVPGRGEPQEARRLDHGRARPRDRRATRRARTATSAGSRGRPAPRTSSPSTRSSSRTHLQFCVDCGIPAMRVDPGDFGPAPARRRLRQDVGPRRDDVQEARRARRRGRRRRCSGSSSPARSSSSRPRPLKLLNDVGDDNLKLMYDVGHVEAVLRDRPQPGAAAGAPRGRSARVRRR